MTGLYDAGASYRFVCVASVVMKVSGIKSLKNSMGSDE